MFSLGIFDYPQLPFNFFVDRRIHGSEGMKRFFRHGVGRKKRK